MHIRTCQRVWCYYGHACLMQSLREPSEVRTVGRHYVIVCAFSLPMNFTHKPASNSFKKQFQTSVASACVDTSGIALCGRHGMHVKPFLERS